MQITIRRTPPLAAIAVLMCLTLPTPAAVADDSASLRRAVETAVAKVKPALVKISVVTVDYDQGREIKYESVGSGVIISKQGHVITNHHVAADARLLTCTLADKSEIDAELVGTDALSDIAVIRLKPAERTTFTAASFGDSSTLKVGDRVFAMGSPLAFSQSVTMGVVSNTELVIPEQLGSWFDLVLDGESVGSLVRWIAHDAAIFPGNSGGPLVNATGEIVGINEVDLGLSGAIPGNLAREVADQIIKHGKVRRSWFGLMTQPLLKSSERKEGVLIGGTVDGSPAEKAGFRAGDILLRIAGKPCTVAFQEEVPIFNHFLMSLPADKEVEAIVLRDGRNVHLKVTPVDREDAMAKPREFKDWGLCASNITFFKAKEMKRPGKSGVLVSSVGPGGPVGNAKPAIIEQDIIVRIGDKPVANLQDFHTATKEITENADAPVLTIVTFERGSDQYLTAVKVGRQDLRDPGLEVKKAWLPAATQVLTRDIAEALGMKDRTGVRVTQVYSNSTAEKAGLKVGDIILSLDGTPIPAAQPEDLDVFPAMVRQYRIGTTADLGVVRGGAEMTIPVELVTSPQLVREMQKYRNDDLELTVRDISFFDRVSKQWPETQTGVILDSVTGGGWASLGGLSVGSLVVGVDGKPVADVKAFEAEIAGIAERKPKSIIFSVRSGISDSFVELRPAWPQD